MGAQDEQVDSPSASEVMEALRDLARLAQQVGSLVADASGVVADRLLERLLLLCAAQHSAIVLMFRALLLIPAGSGVACRLRLPLSINRASSHALITRLSILQST